MLALGQQLLIVCYTRLTVVSVAWPIEVDMPMWSNRKLKEAGG